MGCAGNVDVKTPTLDALAAGGVRLSHCFANNPVCCPSRASMFTGTYPITHRVVSNDLPVRTDLPTLGTVLRDAGYRTGYIGKWHLDGVPRRKFTPPGERRLGFDHYWAVFNCAHDYFNTRYFHDTDELIRREGYEPQIQTDLALGFLDHAKQREEPFALVLSWGPPHDPYPQVPQPYRDMYDPASITLPPNVQPQAMNPLARRLECRRTIADYYAAVTALDDQLARLVQKLEELSLTDETLVVFTSDHGDMLWSHGWMKKQAPYDESVRVPMILRGPGATGGRVTDTLFGLIDLTPTLLGLMDIPGPSTIQGVDLSASIRAESGAHQPQALLIANQHSCDEAAVQSMPEWRGVRTHRYTYVENGPSQPWLLFDNEQDPYQLHNRVNDRELRVERAALSQQLAELLRASGDAFLGGEPLLDWLDLREAWNHRNQFINA
jgi:arylsulfatase A-like enzyme